MQKSHDYLSQRNKLRNSACSYCINKSYNPFFLEFLSWKDSSTQMLVHSPTGAAAGGGAPDLFQGPDTLSPLTRMISPSSPTSSFSYSSSSFSSLQTTSSADASNWFCLSNSLLKVIQCKYYNCSDKSIQIQSAAILYGGIISLGVGLLSNLTRNYLIWIKILVLTTQESKINQGH